MEEDNKKYNYIYFNIVYDKNKNFITSLPPEYKGCDTLEMIKEKEINAHSGILINKVFRFKILPDWLEKEDNQSEYKIDVFIEDENQTKYKYTIEFKDNNRDFYEYNFKIEDIDILPLNYDEQFTLYEDILRNIYKKRQKTKENDDFIISTHLLLNENYEFFFYILIFKECFTTNLCQKHLLLFNPEKINGFGEISEQKLKQIKNIINAKVKSPDKFYGESEDKRLESIKLFYSVALYFNLYYQKDKVKEMFENENICDYLYDKLLSYGDFFKDLILSKKDVIKLLDKAKNYNQVLNFLFYLGKDLIQFLEVIIEKKDLINKLFKEEKNIIEEENKNISKPKDKKIIQLVEIEKYVEPKKEDDIFLIQNQIDKMLTDYNDYTFIKFSPSLIKKYIEFNDEKNLNNLIYLQNIIEKIPKIDAKFKCNFQLDTLIHKCGILFAKNGKLKNIELLDFISTDNFYNDNNHKNKEYRSLEIFEGIDINSLDEAFFKKWKKFPWDIIFENQFNEFLDKIASLIKEMKHFGFLFSFFNLKQEINVDCVRILQRKFNEIFHTYIIKECPNFIYDCIELIYISDKKRVNLKLLLENIQRLLDVETVNTIYINLSEKPNLSKECIALIVNYFTKDKKNANYASLIFFIKKCENIRNDILSNIDHYIIKEEEFFYPEETVNFKFFKELVNRELLKELQRNINTTYIDKTMNTISSLQQKIKTLQIKYTTLIDFFKDGEPEADVLMFKLLDRIIYIFLGEGEQKIYYEKLKDKMIQIKDILKNFEVILNFFSIFYPVLHMNDIKKINNIIYNLKNNDLNYYDNNYKDDYKSYLQYLDEANNRLKMKRSEFFNVIYKMSRGKHKENDKECLKETDKTFGNLKNLFTEKGIYSIDKNLIISCVRPFKEKDLKELDKELKILIDIFKIKEKVDIKKTEEDIILISQREYIYDIAVSIIKFFDELKVKKTNISTDIKSVIKSLEKNKDIQTIKNCKQILNNHFIDIDKKNKNYIDIIILLKNQPVLIGFLDEMTIQECRKLQEVLLDNDNNFVTTNDILDMEKCVEFFKDFGKLKDFQSKTDKEILTLFKQKVEEHKDIYKFFEKLYINYTQITTLLKNIDKYEQLKYDLNNLFNNVTFILSNEKEDFFRCKYFNKNNNKEEFKSKENILALRDKVQLTKKITFKYNYFIESFSEILHISKILENIYVKGYPKKIIVEVKLKRKENNEILFEKEFYLNDQKQTNYIEIMQKLKSILLNYKKLLTNYYKTKPLIRFIYGRQFNLLNYNLNNAENKSIISLLKYITNDLYYENVTDFKVDEKGETIENNINNCEQYLNELFRKNNLNLEKIYESTIIKKEKCQGVYTYQCEKLEKQLFQLYKYLTGNNPIAQNILFCNKNTTNEEITAFIYRAVLCDYNSCFIIGGIESLDFEQKSYIIELLNQFFPKGDEKIKSCLLFLYINKDSDIIKNLEIKRYRKILDLKTNVYESIKYEGNSIEIIKSDKSGVGKSTQIAKEIKDKGKEIIYFPFGGVFTREDIIERLKNLKIGKNNVMHLDLYNTSQTGLMMEFLFSILIKRFYGQNENIFFLSKDIQIKIEIPNTFINFFEKFSILNLFEIKEMKISNLAPLIVPKELDSNIQIVAHYLKALKENKIDYNDLFFPNITPIDFEKNVIIKKKVKYFTSIKVKLLSDNEYQSLIFDSIKDKIKEPTYYQIISFINVLAVQLKKFNQNFSLSAYQLLCSNKNISFIRTFIIQSFIKLTNHFTKGAFTDLLNSEEKVHKSIFGVYNEEKDINNAVNNLADDKHKCISFDDIDPSLLFFHEGTGESFSIITNKGQNDKEYIDFLELKNTQAFTKNDIVKKLPDYKKYSQKQFLEELKNILDIKNEVEKEKKRNELLSLEEIADDYVFTADNFVKIILILLRIRSNIPVIMMGETGCGKTALIRKLSEMKNNGNVNKMKILNIHAGTSDNDIIHFLNKDVIPEAIKIAESEKEEKEKFQKNKQFFEETKIWVFFDEINTCKSMGLISELMCKHTCQGVPLPSNIVFIAACNPYRKRENKGNNNDIKIGLELNQAHQQKKYLNEKEVENMKRAKDSSLVYTVNPLPHSLLNFVFDFGNLLPNDEEKYIRCIIKEIIQKIYYKGSKPKEEKDEDEKIKKLKNLASEMIIKAQNYIREFNDRSAVSLREIRRFNIFYEYFYYYLVNRKKNLENEKILDKKDNEFYQNLDDYFIQVYAINLSIFVSYYLRITDKEQRKGLSLQMNKLFQNFDKSFKNRDFLELPLKEENFIVENISLDKGISKNKALLENIFSLFVAINTKVPIFIVGKPGCSKSLSVQLLIKSMQGDTSNNSFFKKLPKIIVYPYQGSMTSTSKGVESIFNKARTTFQKLKGEDKKNNIPLIYFDEMGLAEHSPNNPLKVIHAELEYDQNIGDKKVAFIGISNWILDAAKMNRGISISIPEPDKESNKKTSLTIANSYDELLVRNYKQFFENLGEVYYSYKQYLKEKHNIDGKEDFHGNRDFYNLIKNAAMNMIEKQKNNQLNEQSLLEIAIGSIERNFAGLQFNNNEKSSLEIFKNLFKKIYPECPVKEYNIIKRIKENINDIHSRYLLIISKSSLSIFVLSLLLSEEKKKFSFYFGSRFKNDLNSEEYSLKVLNKLQVYMERRNILILKNIDSIYPSMYDLFNQNFTVLSNKNYARLAVGSNINTFAYIDNEFKCIIDVDSNKIDEQEPPFLNRFEKHILSLDNILDEELIKESENIKLILDDLIVCDKEIYKGINYDLSKLLINCNIDEIKTIVYKMNKEGNNISDIINYILKKIALTLPQDILVNMRINGFMQKYPEYFDKIINYYTEGEHSNFANFLKTIKNYKNVIYTFSNNLDQIKNINNIKTPLIGIINNENIFKININSIKSENEFEKQIDIFFNEEVYKICIIRLMPYEGDFLNYLKNFIESKEEERIMENNKNKVFIFIVYMSRILNVDLNNILAKPIKEQNEINKKILVETLSNLSDFYQIFIDNLNGNDDIQLHKIIKLIKPIELFKNCFNIDKILYDNILKSISYMNYKINYPFKEINQKNYVMKLSEFIGKNDILRKLMNECICKQIKKDDEDIFIKIFKEENNIQVNSIDITSIIKNYLSDIYISKLNLLFLKGEKDQFFSSLLSNEEKDDKQKDIIENKIIENVSKIYLDNLILNDKEINVVKREKANKVEITLGLNIPGLKPIFNKIINSIKKNIIEYKNNENNIRYFGEEDDKIIKTQKEEYFRVLKNLNNSLINIINEEPLINEIINNNKDNNDKLYNLIINDYYTIFINNIFKGNKNENMKHQKLLNTNDNNKKFLNLMVDLRNKIISFHLKENEEEKDVIVKVAKAINWIESYKEEVDIIQQIFSKLNLMIPDLNEQVEKIIKEKQIKYEITPRNPEYTSIVNEVFFLSLDSILRVITSKEQVYELPSQDFFDLIRTNEVILQDALQLENILNMHSQEVFSLREILLLINGFKENEINTEENIKKIIQYFSAGTACNNEKRQNKLCENLNNFYDFLVEKLGKVKKNDKFNFYKVISFIFLNEFIKITYNKFRELLFEKILINNDIIINSSQLIKIIIENVINVSPNEMENNLDLIKEEENEIFKKLNNANNIFLDEIIMNIFECKIYVYFEKIKTLNSKTIEKYYNKNKTIKNETGIIFDTPLTIFKQLINFLEDYISDSKYNDKKEQNIHLCKLYSIVYVKMYLNKLVVFLNESLEKIGSIKQIIEIIENIKNENFSKVIKIYIFKLIYSYMNNNYEKFTKFDFKKAGLNFNNEFPSLIKDEKQKQMLTYFFIPLDEDDYTHYSEALQKFENIQKNKFKNGPTQLNYSLPLMDIFINITLNRVISDYSLNYSSDNIEYKNFFSFVKPLLDANSNITDDFKKLLCLFYDESIYSKKLRPKLIKENDIIDLNIFEMILYGFKLCTNTLNNEDGDNTGIYSSFFKIKGIELINKLYIPGIDIVEDYHLVSLNDVISHFNKNQDNIGCYVCSCGFYYDILPCGFPTDKIRFNCPNCGLPLGYDKKLADIGSPIHGMVIREGHYRIFKDSTQKKAQMSRYQEVDENFPNIFLNDYISQIIEPIRKKGSFGFNVISRDYFESQNKKVRNLTLIGYRLLNFIAYCHLFFAYCLNYVPKKEMKSCLIKDMNIIKILETDWNLLKEALQHKNINSIQIFMNIIYKKLSIIIKKCNIKSEDDRKTFEDEVEKLIDECIHNYPSLSSDYNEKNKKDIKVDNFDIKAIITEIIPVSEEQYPEKEYPMLKYFNLTKYKTVDDFKRHMDANIFYPLINQIITENPDLYKMENLPAFNEFCNYMIERYSFKISRDDAKKRKLKNEDIYKDNEFNKKFTIFLKSWDKIKTEAIKYQCRDEMPVKNLSENDELIYFLNDNGEIGGGMYMAAAYQNFITWQDTFLQHIIDPNLSKGILNCYVDNIKKKIPIHKAKNRQILLIKKRFANSNYIDFIDVINSFSIRNIFNENGKINYSDYNSFIYDYQSIEEEVGKIILPGVCLFEGDNDLNFVAYWSEGFRGGRTQILIDFCEKYPQKSLDEKEKEIINKYIKRLEKDNKNGYDFKEFFSSMQMIIFYINEKEIMNINETIINILEKAPGYFKISDDCKDFFQNEGNILTVDKILNLFFFIEHLCFKDLVKNLQEEYKVKIPENKRDAIRNKLLKDEKEPKALYKTKDLAAAIRRLISRYLTGKTQQIDFKSDIKLTDIIDRGDLWETKISENEDLRNYIKNQLDEFELIVGQAYDLYELIGEEDKKLINNYKNEEKNIREEQENNMIEEDEAYNFDI